MTDDGLAGELYAMWATKTGLHPALEIADKDVAAIFREYADLARAHFAEEMAEHKACPCLHVEPCDPSCTCVNPYSSRGCARCCSYGSKEQQIAAATHLAAQAAEIARLTHQRDDASVRGGELATRITELEGLTFQQGQEIARLTDLSDRLGLRVRDLFAEQAEDRPAMANYRDALIAIAAAPCDENRCEGFCNSCVARVALRDE